MTTEEPDGGAEPVAVDGSAIAPDPAPVAASPRRRSRWRWLLAGSVAVVVGAAVAAFVVIRRDDGPDHPSAWDPRLADLASFVEEQKGVPFEHPVAVVFLAEAEFKDRLRVDEQLSDEDRTDLEHAEAMLRALGLQGGKGSLLDQANTMYTEGVAAFYDPDRQEIVIPESEPDSLASDATLVHELTHALQDQLGQLEDVDDSEAETGLRALTEGEAEHVKAAWVEGLSDDERKDLATEEAKQGEDAAADLDDINPAMIAMFTAPYSIGAPMVDAIDSAGDVADAFEDPPNSSADVLDPMRWLAPVKTIDVKAPSLADGEDALGDDDVLGASTVYLMLATAMDPADALAAADGWGGDRMQLYETADGNTCVRVAMVGVDDAATKRLGDAVAEWVPSRPDGSASSTRRDGQVRFDACDGDDGAGTLTSELAALPSIRASFVPLLLENGAPADVAACISVELIGHIPFELLSQEDLAQDDQELVATTMADAQQTCDDGG